jgi:hypothetical protein
VGVACSLIGTQIVGEFGPLVTLRIAIGSGLAFLTAQMLDVAIFDRLRDQRWWRRRWPRRWSGRPSIRRCSSPSPFRPA